MMKMNKFGVGKTVEARVTGVAGVAVTVDVKGGLEAYSKALLAIFNNIRENEYLWQVSNNSYNDEITVYGNEESLNAIQEWLSQWGDIVEVEKYTGLYISSIDLGDEYEVVMTETFIE